MVKNNNQMVKTSVEENVPAASLTKIELNQFELRAVKSLALRELKHWTKVTVDHTALPAQVELAKDLVIKYGELYQKVKFEETQNE